jgi:hypothetical protein
MKERGQCAFLDRIGVLSLWFYGQGNRAPGVSGDDGEDVCVLTGRMKDGERRRAGDYLVVLGFSASELAEHKFSRPGWDFSASWVALYCACHVEGYVEGYIFEWQCVGSRRVLFEKKKD